MLRKTLPPLKKLSGVQPQNGSYHQSDHIKDNANMFKNFDGRFWVFLGSHNESSCGAGTKVQGHHNVQRILTLSEGSQETNKILMVHLSGGFLFKSLFTDNCAGQK